MEFEKNVSLKDYTTYKIGGPAKYFFIAKTREELVGALKEVQKQNLPVFILGGGSNLLISENGFDGLAIKVDIWGVEFKNNKALVGAGESANRLALLLAPKGLSGLEWASGMPGTVGGAIYGSAQAFGAKISDVVESVEALNKKTLKIKKLSKRQCQFSLKNSLFKKNKDWVIVSAVLKFKKQNPQETENKVKEFIEYRKTHHPMDFPSAGSTFVNPEIHPVKYRGAVISPRAKLFDRVKIKELYKKYPELENHVKKGVIPVGYMVEKCGLSGKKIGNAQISEKHANFIINLGAAKAEDVLALINLVKSEVKKTFGISIETEVQLVGF